MRRKTWTLFYSTAAIDRALRKCDEARAGKLTAAYLKAKGEQK